MMNRFLLRAVLSFTFLTFLFSVAAQQVNTMYFVENMPWRNVMNPAFQPLPNVYVGISPLAYSHFGFGNNSIALKDIVYNDPITGLPITFLHQNGDKNTFFNSLKNVTTFDANMQLNLLSFGFRKSSSYWTFGITQKLDATADLPKDLFSLLLYGTPDLRSNIFDLKRLGFNVTSYTEVGLGYSNKIDKSWTYGAKLKFLYGNANASMRSSDLKIFAGSEEWKFKGKGAVNYAGPARISGDDLDYLGFEYPTSILPYTKPAGLGAGVDLGIVFKPAEPLTLSASITDLGFIRWSKNVRNLRYSVDHKFEGLNDFDLDTDMENISQVIKDSVLDPLLENVQRTLHSDSYTTTTSPKLNIGGEYSFLKNKLSLGLLSRTRLHNSLLSQELTASVNARPIDWFNMSMSYSVFNGKFSTIGTAIGLRTGFLHWFVAADYLSLNNVYYSTNRISSSLPAVLQNTKVSVPYQNSSMNISVGVNMVFGNHKDTDKDGVPDYKDRCPSTPRHVKVDKWGCPVDKDGDGVPDYLDKCPNTPKEARGHVDKRGCILDTDKDGVADFKDKCPDTPLGVKVDVHGCPIEKKELVLEEIKHVAEDKKEDVKVIKQVEERKVQETDFDGDGVPDHLDKCPDIPGKVENNGCPEVKKESKGVIKQKKDFQGIQFENGSSVILPSSYRILNQVAGVMIANPTYLLEVGGHTDNLGERSITVDLSLKRAESVRKYLIEKGVAPERISAKGYGDKVPLQNNKTEEGRFKNRRVEFIVTFEEVNFDHY